MTYEVELKFPLADAGPLLAALAELNAVPVSQQDERDLYFGHPSRDFASTDEALRLRTVGDENTLTYKGPVVDLQIKTRREIEVPVAPGHEAASRLGDLLAALGFRPVREVSKTRQTWQITWEDQPLLLVLDQVRDLGQFVEIEGLADENSCNRIRDVILRLADRLNLTGAERRSYLCLLLEQDQLSS